MMRFFCRLLAAAAVCGAVAAGIVCGVLAMYPYRYVDLVVEYSEKYGLPPSLVCAVIHAESRFRSGAVSHMNAVGLMQLTQITADWGAETIGMTGYYFDRVVEPEVNIEIGCWYLKTLLKQFKQEQDVALAAYNAGSGNVARWLKDRRFSGDGVTLDEIPFGETKRYVEKVNRAVPVYRLLLRVIGGIYE